MQTEVEISISDGVAYLGDMDPELNEKIVEATSFKLAGVEYTVAYKRGWRGETRLVQHGKCPVGLLPRVIQIIKDEGYTVRIVDTDEHKPLRAIKTHVEDIDSRFYQDEAVLATEIFDRGVIRVSTGGGKTAIGARIIDSKKVPALIIVPTIDLLLQYKNFLTEHLRVQDRVALTNIAVDPENKIELLRMQFEPIGQLGAGVVDPRSVTVATIRTIAKVLNIAYESYTFGEYDDTDNTGRVCRSCNAPAFTGTKCSQCGAKQFITQFEDIQMLREWVESIGLLILDEVHLVGAQMIYNASNKIPAKYKYGMSASPWRDDGADLMIEAAAGPIIYRVDSKVLVDNGFLVPLIVRTIPTHSWWTAAAWGRLCKRCKHQVIAGQAVYKCKCGCREFTSQWLDCYREEIVENVVRNQRIADLVVGLNCPTLVLVKQIKHGQALASMIPGSVFLSGKEHGDTRAHYFEEVRRGRLKVIVCTAIADMGLDLPMLQALVLAGGGKSSTRHLQRIGRVVRPFLGKDHGLVIDFDDDHVATWFTKHAEARRKVEQDEWRGACIWT